MTKGRTAAERAKTGAPVSELQVPTTWATTRPSARRNGLRRLANYEPLILFQTYLALLIFSPSIYIVEPLGAAGTPATIFGLLMLLLWILGLVTNVRLKLGLVSMHWVVGVYVLAMLLAFVNGMMRPLHGDEASSSVRALISLASGAGVILFATDSMRTKPQLSALINSAVIGGTALATMGIIQFFTDINFVGLLHLPGLTANSAVTGLYKRSGFTRVSATAIHSIEFSAVIGTILPLAAQRAITATWRTWWQWIPVTLMVIALPFTVARSGAISLVVGIVFLFMFATSRQRRWLAAALVLGALAFRSALPGLIGTIRSLFAGAGEDNSISGRLEDLRAVAVFFFDSPWIGRGFSTFIPSVYRMLDNQFLATLLEAGIIGALALALLFVVPLVTSMVSARHRANRFDRTQSRAIAAGIGTSAILSVTFDSFGFPMAFGMLCLILGIAGALVRTDRPPLEEALAPETAVTTGPSAEEPERPKRSAPRSIAIATAAGILVLVVAAGVFGWNIVRAQPDFEATQSVLLRAPRDGGNNVYNVKIDVPGMSSVLLVALQSRETRDALERRGVDDYAVGVGSMSLGPLTDSLGTGEMMRIAARASSSEQASSDLDIVREEMESTVSRLQAGRGIPGTLQVRVESSLTDAEVFQRSVGRVPAFGGAIGFLAIAAILGAERMTWWRRLTVPKVQPGLSAPSS